MSDLAERKPLVRYPLMVFSKLFGMLPAPIADAFLAVLARLVYWRGRAQHLNVLQDFRDNVDPTAQFSARKWRPVQAMYRALVRNANDAIWFLAATHHAARRRFRIEDPSPLHAALEAGRPAGVGAIVAFPHLGSNAALPIVLALNGLPTTVVANRQPALMQWVIARGAQKAQLELITVERTGRRQYHRGNVGRHPARPDRRGCGRLFSRPRRHRRRGKRGCPGRPRGYQAPGWSRTGAARPAYRRSDRPRRGLPAQTPA